MRRGRDDGFVLIAALWLVALLALVAVIITQWLTRSIDATVALNDSLTSRREVIDTSNRVLYLLLTNYFTNRGLEIVSTDVRMAAGGNPMNAVQVPGDTPFIALDNRPYKLDKLAVQFQDDLGLFNLNIVNDYTLDQLLKHYQIPFQDRIVLRDRLRDYLDASQAQRLNGATAEDYTRDGRPPPRSAPLLTPWEAFRVLGWDAYGALWTGAESLPDIASAGTAYLINPMTASVPVLGTIEGFNEDAAERLLDYRAAHSIVGPTDLQRATGVTPQDVFQVAYFPADHLRLTITTPNDALAHVIAVDLTPAAPVPYRVNYQVDIPQSAERREALLGPKVPPLLPATATAAQ